MWTGFLQDPLVVQCSRSWRKFAGGFEGLEIVQSLSEKPENVRSDKKTKKGVASIRFWIELLVTTGQTFIFKYVVTHFRVSNLAENIQTNSGT